MRTWIAIVVALSVLYMSPATALAEASMDEEIDYLMEHVAASDCTFIRNGKSHEPASAVSHLELKRKRGKRYFSTTEEFIERVASSSSWSGKPYLIACSGGDPVPIRDWYLEALAAYRVTLASES